MNQTKLQKSVVKSAANRMKHKSWFRGVCLDKLPEDEAIKKNYKEAVNTLIYDTEYWDAPIVTSTKR